MTFRHYEKLSAFAEAAFPLLKADDPLTHALSRRLESGLAQGKRENWTGIIGFDGEIARFCALCAPPHPAYLYAGRPICAEEFSPLSGAFPAVKAIRGEAALLDAYLAASGRKAKRRYDARVMVLDELSLPPVPQGLFRRAGERDRRFFPRWMNTADWTEAVWVWEAEDVPTSMAYAAMDDRPLGWISSVYTSPEYRRQGYASALVGELSRQLVRVGKRCCLAVDTCNEKAEKIYRRLGYSGRATTSTITMI